MGSFASIRRGFLAGGIAFIVFLGLIMLTNRIKSDPAQGKTNMTMRDIIQSNIRSAKVVIFSKTYCPFCRRVKKIFDDMKVAYNAFELDELSNGAEMQDTLKQLTQHGTVPIVFVNGRFIGGADDTDILRQKGELQHMLVEKFEAKEEL